MSDAYQMEFLLTNISNGVLSYATTKKKSHELTKGNNTEEKKEFILTNLAMTRNDNDK